MGPLAYVFWHWRQDGVDAATYEARQHDFHAAMAAAPPDGFAGSFSSALNGAPWANGGRDAYEDWYLVRDFGALGALNESAISGSRAAAHHAAGALAAAGVAGLYRAVSGEPRGGQRVAHWFSKPAGVSYASFQTMLDDVAQTSGGTVWMRQMVLGPTTEFCLHADAPFSLPADLSARVIQLRPVWSSLKPQPA